jgi:PKD repeat protein
MYDVLRKYFGCNATPVANFYSGIRVACVGVPITFRDSSTNQRPTSWNWSFPGGTLIGGTTVTDSMPQVMYNAPGTYAVSYTASTSAGSNSITKNAYITINSNTPAYNTAFVESFETATLPNSDWSVSSTAGLDWAVTSIGAATGSKSVYIDNFSNAAGNVSSLISTTFDISGFSSPTLTFKMAYQQKVSTNTDKLQVLTSTNCGAIWVSRWAKSGAALATVTPTSPVPLYPSPSQFTTYTVNINGVSGSSNVRFKFDFTADPSAPGNYIFIDDINIFDATVGIQKNEAQMGLIIYPNPNNGKFIIETNNTDKQTLQIFDVNGKQVLSQTITGKTNIDVSNLAEGVYNLSLVSAANVINKRLVIVR